MLAETLLALLMAPACGQTAPKLAKKEADAALAEIAKDRKETKDWLRSDPTSYLASVNRVSFGEKAALTVGESDMNDVVLKGGDLTPGHLRLAVEGEKFSVTALDEGATFTLGKGTAPLREAKTPPPKSASAVTACASRTRATPPSSSSTPRASASSSTRASRTSRPTWPTATS